MKILKAPLFMAAALTIGFVACKPSDSKIKSEIEAKLKTEQGLSAVTVDVQKAAVTLAGTTDADAAKSTAETDAKAVKGVKSVVNNIAVNTPAPTVAAPTANAPVIATGDTLSKAITDATKDFPAVKAAIADGVVTLTGTIKREDLPRLMSAVSASHPKKIENKLTINK